MIDGLTAFRLERLVLAIISTFYGLSFLFYCPPRIKAKQTIRVIGFGMHLFALVAHAFLLYLRVSSSQRAPFFGTYESLIASSFAVSLVYFVFVWRKQSFGYGRAAAGVSWLGIFSAFMMNCFASYAAIGPRFLPPVLNSVYFEFHAVSAFLAYGCFTLAFFAAVTSFNVVDDSVKANRLAISEFYLWPGLILFTAALVLGAAWSQNAWGQWWIWTPKFTFSLITWGVFLLALALRHSKGTQRRGFPWLVILGYALVLFTFFGTNRNPHNFM